jgi:hypothetical protein
MLLPSGVAANLDDLAVVLVYGSIFNYFQPAVIGNSTNEVPGASQ